MTDSPPEIPATAPARARLPLSILIPGLSVLAFVSVVLGAAMLIDAGQASSTEPRASGALGHALLAAPEPASEATDPSDAPEGPGPGPAPSETEAATLCPELISASETMSALPPEDLRGRIDRQRELEAIAPVGLRASITLLREITEAAERHDKDVDHAAMAEAVQRISDYSSLYCGAVFTDGFR